jgi:hypothetical protein
MGGALWCGLPSLLQPSWPHHIESHPRMGGLAILNILRLLCSANLQINRIPRRFLPAKAARFATLEEVAAKAFCPLRLCVFAFQMPFGCGSAAPG